jgi:hypothetical protein
MILPSAAGHAHSFRGGRLILCAAPFDCAQGRLYGAQSCEKCSRFHTPSETRDKHLIFVLLFVSKKFVRKTPDFPQGLHFHLALSSFQKKQNKTRRIKTE